MTILVSIDPNMLRADGTIPVMVHWLGGAGVGDPVVAVEDEGGDYWDATVEDIGSRVAHLRVAWDTHREQP